jgi:DNA repair exonuclease SbcCD nuclease subunit
MTKKVTTSKAVLISDIHYNINTLDVADQTLNMAISVANKLQIPVIVAGDLHDTKAHIRGECVKRLISTLKTCQIRPILLRGNHDSLNEKSEEHSLSFLKDIAEVIEKPVKCDLGYLIPYHSDTDALRQYLPGIPKGSLLIMHQGVMGTTAGHYIQDKSALTKEDLASFTVISGHYHTRQSFELPDGGRFTYIGNPYTLNFGEANDPEKGFYLLESDGHLEFMPTNMRKHIVLNLAPGVEQNKKIHYDDKVWVKYSFQNNNRITKEEIAKKYGIKQPFKFDLIDLTPNSEKQPIKIGQTQVELMDALIEDHNGISKDQKDRLKVLWRQFNETK